MLTINVLRSITDFNEKISKEQFIDFLFVHLDRFGDPKKAITKSVDYALSDNEAKGGFLLAAYLDDKLAGVLVMNSTGMGGYIPENILVYVAVDAQQRGHGIGKQIIEKSFEVAEGDVKLHMEYDNPAKRLYERMGFTSKYAEMRYTNNG